MRVEVEHQTESTAAPDEAAGPRWPDPNLVNEYFELQIGLLKAQLESVQKQAKSKQEDTERASRNGRLLRRAAPTALIVTLVAVAVGLLMVLTWSDFWSGAITGSMKGDTETTRGLFERLAAVAGFVTYWKDVLLWLAGGGILITFQRLAYRSLDSAVVIVLGYCCRLPFW